MKVLVTGHQGYIGSVMVPMLLEAGHEVTGYDSDLYERCTYRGRRDDRPTCPRSGKDVRDVTLAGPRRVSTPSSTWRPCRTIRSATSIRTSPTRSTTAAACIWPRRPSRPASRGSSSPPPAATTGCRTATLIDETGELNPVTALWAVEGAVRTGHLPKLADDGFCPTFLRPATAYGLSPRLRFDIVLNNLVAWAVTEGLIYLKSDGTPWRPIVHIEDISRAFIAGLDGAGRRRSATRPSTSAPPSRTTASATSPRSSPKWCPTAGSSLRRDAGPDTRSYRVELRQARAGASRREAAMGCARGRRAALRRLSGASGLTRPEFEGPRYQRIAHIRQLIADGILDAGPAPHRAMGTRPSRSSPRSTERWTLSPGRTGSRPSGRARAEDRRGDIRSRRASSFPICRSITGTACATRSTSSPRHIGLRAADSVPTGDAGLRLDRPEGMEHPRRLGRGPGRAQGSSTSPPPASHVLNYSSPSTPPSPGGAEGACLHAAGAARPGALPDVLLARSDGASAWPHSRARALPRRATTRSASTASCSDGQPRPTANTSIAGETRAGVAAVRPYLPSLARQRQLLRHGAARAARPQSRRRRTRYSYRFLFAPGHDRRARLAGAQRGSALADRPRPRRLLRRRRRRPRLQAQPARRRLHRPGDGLRRLAHAARGTVADFSPYGYDERQFCSPGFDMPVGLFQHSKFGTFPEYHTSADDLDFIRPEELAGPTAC